MVRFTKKGGVRFSLGSHQLARVFSLSDHAKVKFEITESRRMWYRCGALGQSNQVDQLKLLQKITLMKICEFCGDMSK